MNSQSAMIVCEGWGLCLGEWIHKFCFRNPTFDLKFHNKVIQGTGLYQLLMNQKCFLTSKESIVRNDLFTTYTKRQKSSINNMPLHCRLLDNLFLHPKQSALPYPYWQIYLHIRGIFHLGWKEHSFTKSPNIQNAILAQISITHFVQDDIEK